MCLCRYLGLLLLLYVSLERGEGTAYVFNRCWCLLYLLSRGRCLFQQFLQLISLQLLQFGAWQLTAVYAHIHQFLVVSHGEVIRLKHLTLQARLGVSVGHSAEPLLLRYDDGAQHVAVLYHGSLLNL